MFYSAFGLSLAANRSIPGLIAQHSHSHPDIAVLIDDAAPRFDAGHHAEEPYYVSDRDDAVAALRVWKAADGRYFRLRYADDTQFIVAANGREVRAIVPSLSTIEDAATYLLGPVIGFTMRLRGITCLHASVIAMGDQAFAIAGPAGSGKSTAAACFAALGYAVLADDVAALTMRNGVLNVQPAYPQLRLWPDSVAMLYGAPDALPRLTPTWDKRALSLAQPGAFPARALPLRAVYVLGESNEDRTTIENVAGAERLVSLLANSYVGYLLDASMRQQEFDWLVRVAATLPVRQVRGRRNGSELCPVLVEDFEGLGCTASLTTGQ